MKPLASLPMGLWGLLGLLGVSFLGTVPQAAVPTEVDGEPLPSLAPMLERTTTGVVNVATYQQMRHLNPLLSDPFYRRFFRIPQQRVRRVQSAGSGVIVDADAGHIVTNHHLVGRADRILVRLADGREFDARRVGVDSEADLAVLEIEADDLVELAFADSHRLRVGDFVVAIGNPFGLEQTVTSGIVSALGRSGLGIEGYENFIQTDASINPGNSGGALVDLNGRLVGINAAIVAPSGGNVGIGFAIPSNLVAVVMDQIIRHGFVRRGRIGLAVEALNSQRAKALGATGTAGVVVVEVDPGGAADVAGIRVGDILNTIDGRAVERKQDYDNQEAVTMIGDVLEVDIVRNGSRQRVNVSIVLNRSVDGVRIHRRLEGATLTDLHKDQNPASNAGVLVSDVGADTPAWQAGFRSGDILLAVNGHTTPDIGVLGRRLNSAAGRIVLRVLRAGRFGDLTF